MTAPEGNSELLDRVLKPRVHELSDRLGSDPKILVLDLERFPAELVGWGLFNQNFSLNQVIHPGGTFCFAAKWAGKDDVEFYSTHHDGKEEMLKQAHRLLSEAEVVVGWNSKKFDCPHLETEMYLAGMTPPAPYRHVDLMLTVKSRFRFLSNKLDFVSRQSGIGQKVSHEGMPLWLDCMKGDGAAWKRMKTYNCLTPDHKVLTTDLRWVEIGTLDVGDDILGFDENPGDSGGIGRRLKRSTVLGNRRTIDTVYEVTLSNGDKIKCTGDHQWLVSPYTSASLQSDPHGSQGGQRWKTTRELVVNGHYLDGRRSTGPIGNSSVLFKYTNVVGELNTREAGWLAGMLDGEGSLSNRKPTASSPNVGGFTIGVTQAVGPELDRLQDTLSALYPNAPMYVQAENYYASKSNGAIKSTKPIGNITIGGTFMEKTEFLAQVRPERLIRNINWDNLPRLEGRGQRVSVVNIECLGEQEIVILETSTKTYIADGYAMHNCQDVRLTEELLWRLLPWIRNFPVLGILEVDDHMTCRNCGSEDLREVTPGWTTGVLIYSKLNCQSCGAWFRGNRRIGRASATYGI